jgi:hypothetical protein
MSGSSSVDKQISPTVRSTSLPTETKAAKPTPRALPRDISAPIMVPECEATKMRPTGMPLSAKAALAVSITPSRKFTTPRLDGPTTRIPVAAATSRSRCSRAAPSAPVSEKPAARMVAILTPARPHSATASITPSVGSRI